MKLAEFTILPIVIETVLLALFAYAVGLGVGWLAWGRHT